jgi:hypothetical protein
MPGHHDFLCFLLNIALILRKGSVEGNDKERVSKYRSEVSSLE